MNSKWGIDGHDSASLMPLRLPETSELFSLLTEASAHIMNRKGDNGSPCLMLRSDLIKP